MMRRRESRVAGACTLNRVFATIVGAALVLLGLGGFQFEGAGGWYWVLLATLGAVVLAAGWRTGVYLTPRGIAFHGWWRNRTFDPKISEIRISAVPYYSYLNWGMDSAAFAMLEVRSGAQTVRFQFTVGGVTRVRETAEVLRRHVLYVSA